MTSEKRTIDDDLQQFMDMFVKEVLAASDSEILESAAVAISDPKNEAKRIRAMLQNTAIIYGKERLAGAKTRAFEGEAKMSSIEAMKSLSFEQKRALLERLSAAYPSLTLAARQGTMISEADLDSLLDDLKALGIDETPAEK